MPPSPRLPQLRAMRIYSHIYIIHAYIRSIHTGTFDADRQPFAAVRATLSASDKEVQLKTWRSCLTSFTRLMWSIDWEGSLRALASAAKRYIEDTFGAWLRTTGAQAEDLLQLELLTRVASLLDQVVDQTVGLAVDLSAPSSRGPSYGLKAVELCARYLDVDHTDSPDKAIEELTVAHAAAVALLASSSFPKYVQKQKACVPLIELICRSPSEIRSPSGREGGATSRLWSEYELPADSAGWVLPLAAIAESYPLGLVLCDTTLPGNPMVYVNREFVRMTGYVKDEAHGRDCRFLQGPETEPTSVAVIQDALRSGGACHVRITNYRKSGEKFDNLLSMHGIHDSNKIFRFCIGVQLEVKRGDEPMLKKRLLMLTKLLTLLPKRVA